MEPRNSNRLASALLAAGIILAFALAPAGAHGDFKHTWEHIKKKISKPGTINAANNPLEWTRLKNVPAGLADGVDDVAAGACAVGSFITEIESDGTLVCAAAGGSGDITAVTAGTGLTGGGMNGDVALAVDPSAVQTRLQSGCAASQMIRSIDQSGVATCDADDGANLQIVSTQFEVNGGATGGGGSVNCPAGKVAVGGGAEINFGLMDGFDVGVVLRESYPIDMDTWYAEAYEAQAQAETWAIKVYVVCVTAG